MDKKIESYITGQGQNILFYSFENEIGFPRTCGTVSTILAIMLYINKDIRDKYNIFYIRGHFKNNNEEDEFYCDDYEEMSRSNFEYNKCINCNCCDFINAHSWVEITNKETGIVYIIDFTGIQFHQDIKDIESIILQPNLNKDSLFEFIKKYSKFIITKEHENFENYIPDVKNLTGQFLYEISVEKYNDGIDTDILYVLNDMNLTHILKEAIS